MVDNKNFTKKLLLQKSIIYVNELKKSDLLNVKEHQLAILKNYENILIELLKNIDEIELLEDKLVDQKKQLNLLLNLVDELRLKNK